MFSLPEGWFFSDLSGETHRYRWGRSPLGVPFERAKGTKTRLGRSPLRTSLGSIALWLWNTPNRPWGKLIPPATTFAAAPRSSVESLCLTSTGPAIGSDCQPAPNPDAVTKEAPRFYAEDVSGSGAGRIDNSSYLSVGGRCSSAMQGALSGVPRGATPRRLFRLFLAAQK